MLSRCQGTIHRLNDDGVVANEISANGQLQQGRLPIHREFGGAITTLDLNILVLHLSLSGVVEMSTTGRFLKYIEMAE